MSIWIVCRDYHTEGLREPFYAFQTEAAAKAFVDVCQKLGDSALKITEALPGPGEKQAQSVGQLVYPPGVRGAIGGTTGQPYPGTAMLASG